MAEYAQIYSGDRYNFTNMVELFRFVKRLDEQGLSYSTHVLHKVIQIEIL